MVNFFSAMLKCKNAIYNNRDRVSADAFLKVQSFVESGTYSSCKKADFLAEKILAGVDMREIADYLDLSYETIRSEKRTISNELWGIFPQDFFDKLACYDKNKEYIDDCMYYALHTNISAKDLVLSDVCNIIRSEKDTSGGLDWFNSTAFEVEKFGVSAINKEIDLLKRYSRSFLKGDMSECKLSNLKYVLDVLDGKEGTANLRASIIKELKGSTKEC
jgi:hypothetical protein